MLKSVVIIVALGICSVHLKNALADDVYTIIIKKQESKKKDRWSLLDWLALKKTMALQDQWLALNSSSTPWEFYLGGAIGDYRLRLEERGPTAEYDILKGRFGVFAGALGGEYHVRKGEGDFDEQSALAQLRLVGRSSQTTMLKIQGGHRWLDFNGAESFQQFFWGAVINLYLVDFIGAHGLYRDYLESDESSAESIEGERFEAGAFVELGPLRVTSYWFKESLDRCANVTTQESRQGILTELSLYF